MKVAVVVFKDGSVIDGVEVFSSFWNACAYLVEELGYKEDDNCSDVYYGKGNWEALIYEATVGDKEEE